MSGQFSVRLTGFHEPGARAEVLDFLASVFPEVPRTRIAEALTRPPVLLSERATARAAAALDAELTARGARVLVSRLELVAPRPAPGRPRIPVGDATPLGMPTLIEPAAPPRNVGGTGATLEVHAPLRSASRPGTAAPPRDDDPDRPPWER